MAEFNPDEYLKSKSAPISEFNPDEYLNIKPVAQAPKQSFLDKAERQLGLTARYLTEGTVGTADFLATPVRALQNAIMPANLQARPLSQVLTQNLPQPANPTERIVGDVSRALASTGTGIGLGNIAKPVSQIGQSIQEALTSNIPTQVGGAIGGGVGTGSAREMNFGTTGQFVGGLAGGALGGMAANRLTQPKITEPIDLTTKDKTIKDSLEAGYVVPPSSTGKSSLLESIGGKAKTAQEAQIKNQEITNQLAKKYIGLSPNENLGNDAIQSVKELHNPTYEKVAKLPAVKQSTEQPTFDSFGMPTGVKKSTLEVLPSGKSLLDDLKDARAESKSYWDFWKRSGDPKAQRQAVDLDAKVNVLEGKLEELAKYHKQPDLMDELRNARRELAKAHTVNKAMNPATGDISANIFRNMLGKVPLTGEAKQIANFSKAFPELSRVPKTGDVNNFSVLDLAMTAHGLGTGNVPETVFPMLRAPARSAILSDMMQKSLLKNIGKPESASVVPYGSLLNITNR